MCHRLQSAIMGFCCGTLFLNQPKQTIQDGQMYMASLLL